MDYNNYIKVKAPSQNGNLRETSKVDYSKKVLSNKNQQKMFHNSKEGVPNEIDQNMLGFAESYKAA